MYVYLLYQYFHVASLFDSSLVWALDNILDVL